MRQTFLRTCIPLTAVLALAAGVAAAAEPKTPLGKWMKPNMGAPLAGEDYPALQKAFDFVASKPPAGGDYPQWATMSKAGSAAAAKQDLKAVKAACKQCHDVYKEKYIKANATTPFP
jgi:cytochrome c553